MAASSSMWQCSGEYARVQPALEQAAWLDVRSTSIRKAKAMVELEVLVVAVMVARISAMVLVAREQGFS